MTDEQNIVSEIHRVSRCQDVKIQPVVLEQHGNKFKVEVKVIDNENNYLYSNHIEIIKDGTIYRF